MKNMIDKSKLKKTLGIFWATIIVSSSLNVNSTELFDKKNIEENINKNINENSISMKEQESEIKIEKENIRKIIKIQDEKEQVERYEKEIKRVENFIKEKERESAIKSEYKTYKDFKGLDENYKNKIKGTDKWNDLIYKVSNERKIDPIILKILIALESAGNMKTININYRTNEKGEKYEDSRDRGPTQINSKNKQFDKYRLLNDPEYAFNAGIDMLELKYKYLIRLDKETTIENVLWAYNGLSKEGEIYREKFKKIAESIDLDYTKDFYNKPKDKIFYIEEEGEIETVIVNYNHLGKIIQVFYYYNDEVSEIREVEYSYKDGMEKNEKKYRRKKELAFDEENLTLD